MREEGLVFSYPDELNTWWYSDLSMLSPQVRIASLPPNGGLSTHA